MHEATSERRERAGRRRVYLRLMRRLMALPGEPELGVAEVPRDPPSDAYIACWSRGDWWNWKVENACGDAGALAKRP